MKKIKCWHKTRQCIQLYPTGAIISSTIWRGVSQRKSIQNKLQNHMQMAAHRCNRHTRAPPISCKNPTQKKELKATLRQSCEQWTAHVFKLETYKKPAEDVNAERTSRNLRGDCNTNSTTSNTLLHHFAILNGITPARELVCTIHAKRASVVEKGMLGN